MNKTAIKNFAIWARNKLIADICYRAGLMGITEKGIADPLPQSTLDAQFYDIGAAEPYLVAGEAIKQRRQLVSAIREKEADTDYATAYQYIMEEVAYTWFNRLIAVRFMEVNDYLPSHLRVLSSESGKVEPDLVTTPFDADLPFTAEEEAQIIQWKQDNKLDELFRFLFIKQCNALNEILPGLFEKTTDYTEVLLNLSVVDQEGVVYKLTHDIPEKDFNIEQGGQVEIIGWLYQYYNTELNGQVYDGNMSKSRVPKELLPAATTIYTPDWAIRYMVENSLGRLWVEGHPDCGLKENWKYYLEEAQQEPEVQAKLSEIRKEYAALNPEDLTLIDPCMGSGHILVYAFDVLMQIYESVGYSQRDAAKSILEHNIYGLDIDDRAYQLAYFAVMMKARQYNRRILNGENTCHVYAIQESNSINRAHLKYFGAGMDDIEKNAAKMQLEGLLDTLTDAKEYGSILNVESYNWDLLRQFVAAEDTAGQISMDSVGVEDTAEQLNRLIDIGETMVRRYWVTCTNPPYLGSSRFSTKLNSFIASHYADVKADLSMAMYKRALNGFCIRDGFVSFITTSSWMFISSFERLRDYVLTSVDFDSLVDFGTELFDGKVGHNPIIAWVNRKSNVDKTMTCIRLVDYCYSKRDEKEQEFFNSQNYYYPKQTTFSMIPGSPIAYWVGNKFCENYKNQNISNYAEVITGMTIGDNNKYLRVWFEPEIQKLSIGKLSMNDVDMTNSYWIPYSKGGQRRNWYGNYEYVVNWSQHQYFNRSKTTLRHLYLRKAITWPFVTSGLFSARLLPHGFLWDVAGSPCFFKNDDEQYYALGFLCSKVANYILNVVNPTINVQAVDISKLPLIINDIAKDTIIRYAEDNINISKKDWDSFETSWDFTIHPLVYLSKGLWDATATAATMDYYYGYLPEASCPLEVCYLLWQGQCNERFNKLKANEEELNRIFIDIYGLQDELTPEVEEKDVTVRKADLQRDIKSLLSYAVGCMFGRYSLDVPGLAYAGGKWEDVFVNDPTVLDPEKTDGSTATLVGDYVKDKDGKMHLCTFAPDVDNVIPITDEEYLEDDIIARLCDWLKVVYGEDTLEANLDYIAKALGNKGSTSREVIRNYFVNDFFKDHCQTYSVTGSGKRPIYWLFDSGKQNGFKALVYLHRYTPDTIGTLRVDYLHKMQRVYESEINRMQDMMDHTTNAREAAAASKRKDKLTKQLKECRDYDEKISHLALSRIALDLDDGVKVNYRKLQTAADGKFYEVLADSKNIMAKEKK